MSDNECESFYVFYKVVLKTLIDIVPLQQSYVFFFAWKWLFAETLDNYCKKLAGPGMVFSVQGEGTFREAILLSTVYCTSEGKEPIFYLMDANYHYWAHPYQFGMQRTKNSMRSIFAWYVPSLSLNTWNGQILQMLELG